MLLPKFCTIPPDDQGVVSEDFIKEEICFKSNQHPSVFFTRKSIIVSLSRVLRVEFIKCMQEPSRRVDRNSTPTCFVLLSSSINHEMQTLARTLARLPSVVHRKVQARAELGTLRSGYQIMSFEILEVHSPPPPCSLSAGGSPSYLP